MNRLLQLAAALDKPTLPARHGAAPRPDTTPLSARSHPQPKSFIRVSLVERQGGGTPSVRAPKFARLAAIFVLASLSVPATGHAQQNKEKKQKPAPENVEWIWQYTPDADHKDGRENDLAQDLHFKPFLDQFFTAPQSFWGTPIDGHPRSLATTALDHLTVPDKVLADDNRYVSISGCVVHFCPARGLLWLDLNGAHHLAVFAAIDWVKEGHPTTDPAAEYTLWVFPDDPLTVASPGGLHPPAALLKAIARWAAEPLPGSGIVQKITHAILVDPDGTPHEVAPSALGIASPTDKLEPDAAPLKPRN
jgi:hypothetical protein